MFSQRGIISLTTNLPVFLVGILLSPSIQIGRAMADGQSTGIVWHQVLISSLVTAIFSLVVGILTFYYTSKSPRLPYTIFPVSEYRTQNKALTIYNIQIENSGNKEAEDVMVAFVLPVGTQVVDFKIEPSSKAITHTVDNQQDLSKAVFRFPLLNPQESVKFSFLSENATPGNIEVSLRAKGVIGESRKITTTSSRDVISSPPILVWIIIVINILLFSMVVLIITNMRR